MFNFAKKVAAQVAANSVIVACDQWIRSSIEDIVRTRRQEKRSQQDNKRVR
jgi:hypothetical protein